MDVIKFYGESAHGMEDADDVQTVEIVCREPQQWNNVAEAFWKFLNAYGYVVSAARLRDFYAELAADYEDQDPFAMRKHTGTVHVSVYDDEQDTGCKGCTGKCK